jgi:alternate signal-mediated exported protein
MAETRRSPRATKALVAGAAAALLLAAGGGTFARWHDDTQIQQDRGLASGTLTISGGEDGTWTDERGVVVADPTAYLLIPGTTLTYQDTVDVVLQGEGITGSVTSDFSGITGAGELAGALQVGFTFDGESVPVEGATVTGPVLTQSGTHTVKITVAFPGTRANGDDWGTQAQGDVANLTAFTLSLTQGAKAPAAPAATGL